MTRKEKLIQEYLAEPIKVGDSVFLNVNFTGKPMSQEHIEFVKSIKII